MDLYLSPLLEEVMGSYFQSYGVKGKTDWDADSLLWEQDSALI